MAAVARRRGLCGGWAFLYTLPARPCTPAHPRLQLRLAGLLDICCSCLTPPSFLLATSVLASPKLLH